MRAAAVTDDLMVFSRIDAAASAADASLVRASAPADLSMDLDVVLVDWAGRGDGWAPALEALRRAGARVVLFGPHTDIESHRAAREAGLGPMLARSKLLSDLGALLGR